MRNTMEVERTWKIADMEPSEYPLFVSDAMKKPGQWIDIGAGRKVKFDKARGVVEMATGLSRLSANDEYRQRIAAQAKEEIAKAVAAMKANPKGSKAWREASEQHEFWTNKAAAVSEYRDWLSAICDRELARVGLSMWSSGSEAVAKSIAEREGLFYGFSILNGKWYVGTKEELDKIGVAKILGGNSLSAICDRELARVGLAEWSPNKFWVWEGDVLRAAQSTIESARRYLKPGFHITSENKPDGKVVEKA